jgi:hypothetical protein
MHAAPQSKPKGRNLAERHPPRSQPDFRRIAFGEAEGAVVSELARPSNRLLKKA